MVPMLRALVSAVPLIRIGDAFGWLEGVAGLLLLVTWSTPGARPRHDGILTTPSALSPRAPAHRPS
jgi:hypothetical protein